MAAFTLEKVVEEALEEMRAIPLTGFVPPFPWESLGETLSSVLELPGLKVKAGAASWKKAEELLKGMGKEHQVIAIELAPLSGAFFWSWNQDDAAKLSLAAMTRSPPAKSHLTSDFLQGMTQYIALHLLRESPIPSLSPRLGVATELPQEMALSVPVSFRWDGGEVQGRALFPASLVHALRAHFAEQRKSLRDTPLFGSLALDLRLEVGGTTLDSKRFLKVKKNDLVLLDRCTIDPKKEIGRGLFVLGHTPLFRVRMKEDQVKIIDFAFFVEEVMTEPGEEDNEELEGGEEMPDDHLWSPSEATEEKGDGVETLVKKQEIPVTLTVEIARVRMNLNKLLEMKPGNLLDLKLSPDEGVYLTAQGRRVMKGELVQVGEMLGVKITQVL